MTLASQRSMTIFLAALAAGLGYLNWWRLNTAIDISPITPEQAEMREPASDELAPSVAKPSLEQLADTVKRPLFRSDRRPPSAKTTDPAVPAEPQAAAGTTSADGLRFIGVMRAGASKQRALIRVAGAPVAMWVEPGSGIGGWTVKAIETDHVLLQRDGNTAELKLYAPGGPAAPAP